MVNFLIVFFKLVINDQERMPVISFWSKGQVQVELIFYLPGNPQLHIYSLNFAINQFSEWRLVSNISLAIDFEK